MEFVFADELTMPQAIIDSIAQNMLETQSGGVSTWLLL
jgi:hypothetical protein